VVGIGHADKSQVSHMVAVLLNHREALEVDAADALAVALCHAHTRLLPVRLAGLPVAHARRREAGRGLRR